AGAPEPMPRDRTHRPARGTNPTPSDRTQNRRTEANGKMARWCGSCGREDPGEGLRAQELEVDGPAVEGGEAGGPVEAGGGAVADVDGQLQAGGVGAGQGEGVGQGGAAEPPAAGGGSQPEVGDLPGVA